ncbi:hypothetical protein SBOR_2613 [Sclerotinia borealis F-4128]|uniref:Uncharacterized protein n=1 Tax=Sclerotinia borealis (strain F-4128) TaxID=1432307 RepID=W9CJN9_SCLBF|nr:hypothetical protein SBOR_2613 [Sclerotinia borealis F-4128]
MASRGSKSRIPRTTLAELYGHLRVLPIRGVLPLKSGLTPVSSKPNATSTEKLFVDDVRWMQRQSSQNFTAAELESLDALAPLYKVYEVEDVVSDSVDIAIHPVMRRVKWNPPRPKHLAEFPMGEERDGYWNAYTNDVVWEALLPSIRIASLYLSNADLWPWFDALFAAEWADIPEKEVPKNSIQTGWKRFVARNPMVHGSEESRRNVRDKILHSSKNIFFCLSSAYVDRATGVQEMEVEHGSLSAVTVTNLAHDISVVTLCLEPLEALLPGNVERLNGAERCLVQVDIATTILHELAHALYQREYIVAFPDYGPKELFYQQQIISELGFSIFGGAVSGIRTGQLEGALACLLNMGSKRRFEGFVKKYGAHTVEYTKVVGTEYLVNRRGICAPLARDPFVEFEGIPNMRRRTRSGMDRLEDSERYFKRRRVQAVVRKAYTLRASRRNREEISQTNSLYQSIDIRDNDLPPCPRFDETSTYLIDNRRQLALHTMCFVMPENTLRDYILRLGGLAISAYEWRAYLLHCEALPYLFRFKPEGNKWGETSTYRGSIQLHASSWPKTDLTPLKPRREIPQIDDTVPFLMALTAIRMKRNSLSSSDEMWISPIFWDFSAEEFLAAYNADIKQGGTVTSNFNVTKMSEEELEDILWHLASTSSLLTWAPCGIIRRLPLTDPESQELLRGTSTFDDIVFPKGRGLVDWDGDYESLYEWDNTEMETDQEILNQDRGITFADGCVYSYRQYYHNEELKEARAREAAEGHHSLDYIALMDDYLKNHPGAGVQETFDRAFWPSWSVGNPDGSTEEAFVEFKEGLWHEEIDVNEVVEPLDLASLAGGGGWLFWSMMSYAVGKGEGGRGVRGGCEW